MPLPILVSLAKKQGQFLTFYPHRSVIAKSRDNKNGRYFSKERQ
jgi:hypothetical protein